MLLLLLLAALLAALLLLLLATLLLLLVLLLLPGHAVRLAVALAVRLAVGLAAERTRSGHLYLGSRFLLDGIQGLKSLTAAAGIKGGRVR